MGNTAGRGNEKERLKKRRKKHVVFSRTRHVLVGKEKEKQDLRKQTNKRTNKQTNKKTNKQTNKEEADGT